MWEVENLAEKTVLRFDKYAMTFSLTDENYTPDLMYVSVPTRKQLEELYEEIKCVLGESSGS